MLGFGKKKPARAEEAPAPEAPAPIPSDEDLAQMAPIVEEERLGADEAAPHVVHCNTVCELRDTCGKRLAYLNMAAGYEAAAEAYPPEEYPDVEASLGVVVPVLLRLSDEREACADQQHAQHTRREAAQSAQEAAVAPLLRRALLDALSDDEVLDALASRVAERSGSAPTARHAPMAAPVPTPGGGSTRVPVQTPPFGQNGGNNGHHLGIAAPAPAVVVATPISDEEAKAKLEAYQAEHGPEEGLRIALVEGWLGVNQAHRVTGKPKSTISSIKNRRVPGA